MAINTLIVNSNLEKILHSCANKALVWLNLYGREAVQRRLKKGKKCILRPLLFCFYFSLVPLWARLKKTGLSTAAVLPI